MKSRDSSIIGVLNNDQGVRMIDKEKLHKVWRSIKHTLKTNKKLIIVATGTGLAVMVLVINMHFFQMSYYMMCDHTIKIAELIERDLTKKQRQDDWYFKEGLTVLLDELDDTTKTFVEEKFGLFIPERQEEIIGAYNKQKLTFKQNQVVFETIINTQQTHVYRNYMHNLSVEELEKGLKLCFGETPKLTQDSVAQIYKIVSLQQQKLVLQDFKINPYELMMFPHNGDVESISLKLLDTIAPEAVKESLFKELKTNPIEMEVFATWVDILNKKKIISTNEYAQFTTSYGNIKRIQDRYKQVLIQEVDLQNIKQMTDVQTEQIRNTITKLETQKETAEAQRVQDEAALWELNNYKEMNLYVLDQYQNGDYEVAIPQQSWLFGTYKPSSEKVRLTVTRTAIEEQGVKLFQVYNQGLSEEGLPYYREVSNDDLAQIEALKAQIQKTEALIDESEKQINQLQQEVAQIHKQNNYEQTVLLLEEVAGTKESLELEIKKEKVAIQNLFEIGELLVNIKKEEV